MELLAGNELDGGAQVGPLAEALAMVPGSGYLAASVGQQEVRVGEAAVDEPAHPLVAKEAIEPCPRIAPPVQAELGIHIVADRPIVADVRYVAVAAGRIADDVVDPELEG